jgi:hypothetical protein
MCRVGQNHIHKPCINSTFGRKITKYTVIYNVYIYIYIRFWPTLLAIQMPAPGDLHVLKGGQLAHVLGKESRNIP